MKTVTIIAILCCFGCGVNPPMSVIMTNPETGKSVHLSQPQLNMGILGGARALAADNAACEQQDQAIKAHRMMGYTEMKVVK